MPPRTPHNVRIDFEINQINDQVQPPQPYYGYVWSEGSVVKVNSTDFLGKRGLEITRGNNGFNVYTSRKPQTLSLAQLKDLQNPTEWRLAQNLFDAQSNLIYRAWTSVTNLPRLDEIKPDSVLLFHVPDNQHHIASMWDTTSQHYLDYVATNTYELKAAESPAIADQLQAMVLEVQQALPNILALTNKLAAVLDNAANATSNLNLTIADSHPLMANFAAISGQLRGPGALGAWVLGTNAPFQVETALTNANLLLVNVNTNMNQLTEQIGQTLDNLAGITSNLNVQVQANSNMLGGISKTVMDSDSFIQGLKHHWLLRSAFKSKATNQPDMMKK
jgi:hypothetical protein